METYIPASSPLISSTPCSTCPPVQYIDNGSGGFSAKLAGGNVALTFTGTGLMLNHTTSPQLDLTFNVNGSTVSPLSGRSEDESPFSITEFSLPYGRHNFVMGIAASGNPLNAEEAESVLHGCLVETGMISGSSTTDVTIDDKAWRTGQITLTDGWNMLETPAENSNFIDTELVETELPTLGNDSDGSISFTQRAGSSLSIAFEGQAVWAYGISGGEAGRVLVMYGVQLDDGLMQVLDASPGPRSYQSLLYMATGLPAGNHTLSFTNIEGGKPFSFDRLVAIDGITVASQPPLTSPTALPSSTPTNTNGAITFRPEASSSHASGADDGHGGHPLPDIDRGGPLSTAAVAGVSVAVLGIVTVLGFVLFWFCARVRRRRAHADAKKRTTFLNISESHLGSRERKHFSRIQSPYDEKDQLQNGAETDHIRFPGLRALPLRQGRDGQVKRKKSFLDMTVQIEPEHHHDDRDRRILPLNHAAMGGESPLTELVRYSPHDPPVSSGSAFEDTYGRHHPRQPSGSGSQMTGRSAGTGMILPPALGSQTAPTCSPRPSGPGGAF